MPPSSPAKGFRQIVFIAPQKLLCVRSRGHGQQLKGSPHSRERGESEAHRDARTGRTWRIPQGRASNACRCLPTALPSAGSVHLMRSPRPWCFSHPTTAATLRERNCLWMAVSHKCRPFIAEGCGINNCSSAPHLGQGREGYGVRQRPESGLH
jgi:hypothetical protein